MKKLYLLLPFAALPFCKPRAQCSVGIAASPNTTVITCKEPTVTLTANATGTGTITYAWDNGVTAPSQTATKDSLAAVADRLYTVTITDSANCTATASVRISKNIAPPVLTAAAFPAAFCLGGSANLVVFGADSVAWNPDSLRGNVVTVRPAATATFTATGFSYGNGCTAVKDLTVTVHQLPTASVSGTVAVCQNSAPQPVTFTGTSGTRPFSFAFAVNGGTTQLIGTPGAGNAVTVSAPASALGTFRYDLLSVSDSNGCAQPQTGAAVVTVLPGPSLVSAKQANLCNATNFNYTASSSLSGTTFGWTRPAVTGISNPAGGLASAVINETLNNTTSQPVVVNYIFALSAGTGCTGRDTLKVTVNPTPVLNTVADRTYCNGTPVDSIPFGSATPGALITWTNSNPAIGLPASGSGSIPVFVATNARDVPVSALLIVNIRTVDGGCTGSAQAFRITVNPSPRRPGFTSLNGVPDGDTLRLCGESRNINFNVTSPDSAARYRWVSALPNRSPLIRDTARPNTVVSFGRGGEYRVQVIASRAATGCADSVLQVVQVSAATNGAAGRERIFAMQPGDLLVYPDNSLQGYQWGYDSVLGGGAFGPPRLFAGQARQYFVPAGRLDTVRYLYWVLLKDAAGCQTRVYYNGPYAARTAGTPALSGEVRLLLRPNPTNGTFELALSGNIYGKMEARIYNSIGHVVFRKSFAKTVSVVNERFNASGLPAGLYFLEVTGSDLKKTVTRFVIGR